MRITGPVAKVSFRPENSTKCGDTSSARGAPCSQCEHVWDWLDDRQSFESQPYDSNTRCLGMVEWKGSGAIGGLLIKSTGMSYGQYQRIGYFSLCSDHWHADSEEAITIV
jgi:hypothetical protein